MSQVSLNGKWQVRALGAKSPVAGWLPATVPGCVHTDLMAAKAIPDPYYRRNELDVLWMDSTDWQYRRTVRATKADCEAALQELVFEGLDTSAEVTLNGKKVGSADNMFRRWRFDVRGVLKPGQNELVITFQGPVTHGHDLSRKSKSTIRGGEYANWNDGRKRNSYRPYIRKGQYQFGWDWGPFLATSGIWQPCYLLTTNEPVLEYVTIAQTHGRGKVDLAVTAHVLSPGARKGTLRVKVDGQTVDVEAQAKKGSSQVEAAVVIRNPRLWWPAGAGDQPLYPVTVEWIAAGETRAADVYRTRIGLRKVELVQEKDAEGSTFKFRINGRDIFCKGANWIPDDVFPTRTTRERLKFLVQSTVDANMNMLRVWGGGIYAEEDFLDLCDEMGVMLWHDFMFACAGYPEDGWFFKNVEGEMRHQIRRMYNRPSIVLWCGNNENQTAVDVWWKPLPEHKKLLRAYNRLTYDVEERVVLEEDTTRPWWPSSPSGYPREGDYSFGWEKSGDMHDWNVWHRRQDFAYFLTTRPRFNSEFGFQSFPSVDTLKTVARPEDMNVTSPVMEHHQRHRSGNSIITDFLTRQFRFPMGFADFCYLSQVNHGLAMKMAIEHWRRIKPRCMGTLYWQINDDWPVASWASIDWTLRWKALHYMARRFNAPLMASVSDDDKGLRLWATSDLADAVKGTWTAEAWTFAGRRVWKKSGRFDLRADESRAVAELPKEKIIQAGGGDTEVFLVVGVKAPGHESHNTYAFVPLKRAELKKANIRAEIRAVGKGYSVRLSTDAPAFHVELSTGDVHGLFSDNIVTLLPGRATTVKFVPQLPTTLATLKKKLCIRHVRGTY